MDHAQREEIRDLIEEKFVAHRNGEKVSDCAVVIPAGADPELLEKHMRILALQEGKDFDVIVIGAEPGRAPAGINVVSYGERMPLGSSGGFGLGQLLAFCMGYECIINADLDCTPISTDAVKKLRELAMGKQKLVLPRSVYDRNYDPRANRENYNVNQYGTIPAALLERLGFMYFRFFKGGEDAEFIERARLGGFLHCEKTVVVEHKNAESNFIERMKFRGAKYVYYEKNWPIVNIMLASACFRGGRLGGGLLYSAKTFLNALACMIVNGDQTDLVKAHIVHGLLLDMGKKYRARSAGLGVLEPNGRGCTIEVCEAGRTDCVCFRPKEWLVKNSKSSVVAYLLSKQLEVMLAPASHVEPSAEWIDDYKFFLGYLLIAKPVKYLDGKTYRYGPGTFGLVLKFAAFAVASPLVAAVIAVDVLRVGRKLDYPVTAENLMRSLEKYHEYLVGPGN